MSTGKIYMDGEGTNLQLFAGIVTQFEPPEGDLQCLQVAVLAEDYHIASTVIAMQHPEWDLQSLTNLTAFAWFKRITLDPNCPQAVELRQFVMSNVKGIPLDAEEGTFRR